MVEDSFHDFGYIIRTGDILVQRPYLPEDTRWYVQEVGMLDLGRFENKEAAAEHLDYLLERQNKTSP